ncbi:MAG: HNH endonuclease [Candidatus Sabulitectum sp.]|nr:HNH endonuclease [Candidatus Sabulitectum sp.]
MPELTQEKLKELLNYDPNTGIFTWKVDRRPAVKTGDIAGTITSYGYRQICVNYNLIFAHRLAFLFMTGAYPSGETDHINHISDDNRWCNLREVTSTDNNKNKPLFCTNTSGFTGVFWHSRDEKWVAKITVDGKRINLGSFNQKKSAIEARKRANIKYGFHQNHGIGVKS